MIDNFRKLIRFDNWWGAKIPPLLTVAYYFLLVREVSIFTASGYLLQILVWAFAAASFGHLVNDYFDRKEDVLVGREEVHRHFSSAFIFGGMAVLILVAFSAIWSFRSCQYLIPVVAVHLFSFVLYSVPEVRLKERPMAGIIMDALYAHVLPALVVVLIVSPCTISGYGYYVFFAWLFVQGLRNIVLHQIRDMVNDKKSGISTFATTFGQKAAYRIVNLFLFPLEVLLLVVLLYVVSDTMLYAAGFVLLYWLLKYFTLRKNFRGSMSSIYEPHPSLGLLNNLYEEFFPLLLIVYLIIGDSCYLIIGVLHLALFKRHLFNLLKLPAYAFASFK